MRDKFSQYGNSIRARDNRKDAFQEFNKKGPLAHLVERIAGSDEATGSNPVWSTKFNLSPITRLLNGIWRKPKYDIRHAKKGCESLWCFN